MKFIHRLAFYLFGFSIGLIFLFFFLNKKGASCDYSPNARVLKNIRSKSLVYTNEVFTKIQEDKLDTAYVSYLLQHGNVDFGESNTQPKDCKRYVINGNVQEKKLTLQVENCAEEAVIISLSE